MGSPIPIPTCVQATIFADCFGSCIGIINGASPGPICGWTYIEPFGPLGGQFSFTPGVMSMDSFDANDFPIDTKPLPSPLASVFGISGQFTFMEYTTPPNATTTYQIVINNIGLTESLFLSFFGDGSIIFQAGDPNAIPTYIGTWIPNGGIHTVHYVVDGAGIPTLYLDGVVIPLTFFGNIGSFAPSYPANSINYGGGSGDPIPGVSPLMNMFITAGAVPPTTEFCCT